MSSAAWMRRYDRAGAFSIIALALLASACSVKTTPPTLDAPTLDGIVPGGPEPTVERQLLESLDDSSMDGRRLANNELSSLRGGIRINGLDLSIAAQITTVVLGRVALTSELVMNDAGRWEAVASQSQIVPAPSTPSPSSQGVQVNLAPQGTTAPGTPSLPAVGSTNFQAVAGNAATTEIVQKLMNNSISTLVSNRVNGATIDQSLTLNISARNFSSFSRMTGAFTQTTFLANDIARFH